MKIVWKAILFIVLCIYLMILSKLILFKYMMVSDIGDLDLVLMRCTEIAITLFLLKQLIRIYFTETI